MRPAYLWDYDLDEESFNALFGLVRVTMCVVLDSELGGCAPPGYASYPDIVRLLGFHRLIAGWPKWRSHIRSISRRRGFDFLIIWLPR